MDEGTDSLGGRYRPLRAGAHALDAQLVSRDQRERLCAAMTELVADRGYAALTVTDLTRLAHVSRPTFYQLFEGKQACFLAAYSEAAREMTVAVVGAYRAGADERTRIHASLAAYLAHCAREPARMSLVLGAAGAGPEARRARAQMIATLIRRLASARGHRVQAAEEVMLSALLGGVGQVSATRLRAGRGGELPGLSEDLTDWAACYPEAVPGRLLPAATAAERRKALGRLQRPQLRRARAPAQRLPSGQHDLSRSYVQGSQRDRLLDAVAELAAEDFARLSIPAIAKRAGISYATFYEMFATKQEAFLAAVATAAEHWLALSDRAYRAQDRWPAGIAAGIHVLLAAIAAEPAYAGCALVELASAGPQALSVQEQITRTYTAYLRPGYKLAAHSRRHVPQVAGEAIAGGIWQLIHREVAAGRAQQLPLLAPAAIFLVLTPFLGAGEATRVARRAAPRAAP